MPGIRFRFTNSRSGRKEKELDQEISDTAGRVESESGTVPVSFEAYLQNYSITDRIADPYPTFHFDADPEPAPHRSDANLRPLVYRPSIAKF